MQLPYDKSRFQDSSAHQGDSPPSSGRDPHARLPTIAIIAGWLWAALPRRMWNYRLVNPVVCICVFLSLFAAWTGANHWKNSQMLPRLHRLQDAIERRLLSTMESKSLHDRVFASQAIRLVEGMNEIDRNRLNRAMEERNNAFPRAQWRFALDPISLNVTVDGTNYGFLSDELIFNRYRSDHLRLLESPAFVECGEFLPWEIFRPIQYDQMPRPVAEFVLDLQIERFKKYLKPEQWAGVTIDEWRKIPDPVRKIAAYRMAWRWAAEYAPEWMRREEAARILASVGRVESLFDIDKVVNRNPITGKEDLGFLQISEGMRQRLRRLPQFEAYERSDYLTPWVSIQAGAYSLFSIFLEGAGGDILEAIGHYNAGRHGLEQRAENYVNAVLRQYDKAFIDKKYSPTLRLLLGKADPRYFRGVHQDVLYRQSPAILRTRTD